MNEHRVPFARATGGALAGLALAVLLLGGCSEASPDAPQQAAADVDFTGPWASEFRTFYDEAGSDFERGALADGTISDQEYSEMTERFTSCLTAAGLSFTGFQADGSYTVTPTTAMDADTSQERTDGCSVDAGEQSIGALHSWTARNPDNQDQATIMVDCMIGRGVVGADYTAADWNRENALSSLPASVSPDRAAEYEECVADPLGLAGG